VPSPWLDAYTWDGLQPLMDAVQAQEAKVVIIDNLLAVKGRADENSAEMGRVMAHFRRFTEKMGVATILIHHQRKEIAANSRAGDRVRGHSSIEAALDLALLVERAYQSDLLTIRSTKERGVMVPPFGALFTYEHQGGTVELATAKFFGTEVEDSVSDRAIEQAVLAAVKDTPTMIQKDLVAAVKADLPDIGVHRIRAIVKRLEHQQRLQRTQGARTSVRYTVP
jgi:RecA-family ATPase